MTWHVVWHTVTPVARARFLEPAYQRPLADPSRSKNVMKMSRCAPDTWHRGHYAEPAVLDRKVLWVLLREPGTAFTGLMRAGVVASLARPYARMNQSTGPLIRFWLRLPASIATDSASGTAPRGPARERHAARRHSQVPRRNGIAPSSPLLVRTSSGKL
jgi:hypothetical protein